MRAIWAISMSALALFVTVGLSFFAYHQTGLLAEGALWRGGIFCGVLLGVITVLFMCGYAAFAHFFRAATVILSISCLLSASYFISSKTIGLRDLGIAFVLLMTLPLIAFYLTTFTRTIRGYMLRRRWLRDHMA